MKDRVSATDVSREAESIAKALAAKWPGISTSFTLQTPSAADAWVIVKGANGDQSEIGWDAAELEWDVCSAKGIDIVTIFEE